MTDTRRINKAHLRCDRDAMEGTVQVLNLPPATKFIGIGHASSKYCKDIKVGITLYYMHWDVPHFLPYKIVVIGEHQTYSGRIDRLIGSLDFNGKMYFVFEVE